MSGITAGLGKVVRVLLNLMMVIVVSLSGGCVDEGEIEEPNPPETDSRQLMMPDRVLANSLAPVMLTLDRDIRLDQNEDFIVASSMRNVSGGALPMKRGRGGVLLTTSAAGTTEIRIETDDSSVPLSRQLRVLDNLPIRELSGALSGDDLLWDSSAVIRIDGSVTVPAGAALGIGSGTIVQLGSLASIRVEGSIQASGFDNPVQFLPLNPDQPWGEIYHAAGSSGSYNGVFFIGGGGDPSRAFGHSGSQPVLSGFQCTILATGIAVMDCLGKAFGFRDAELTIRNSLITRCDTGGEFEYALVNLVDTHVFDIPDGNGIIDDDDNDGLYFHFPWSGGDNPSVVSHCVIMTTEDDGIDHNQANLRIEGSVIDGAFHEGVAASGQLEVWIQNSLILNCGQGIEMGFGTAQVTVNHCTLLNNRIGLRLGDSYTAQALGTMIVTNSIVTASDSLNIWNYDLSIEGPRENVFDITYSIVNSPEYESGAGCLSGEPVFAADYQITPESVGAGAASDGYNMGISPFPVFVPTGD